MEKEFILKKMGQLILVCGLKIYNMDLEYKNGMMDHLTKENIMMAQNMERVNLHGLMDQFMKAVFKII